MADTKITALTALTGADPANDVIPIVDVSDTTMAASGTTKKISVNNILGASGTATLASATITGDLTVDTSTLKVDSANNRVGIGTASPGCNLEVYSSSANELRVSTITAGDVRLGMSVIGTTYNWIDSLRSGGAMVFGVGNAEHYRITSGGAFTWSDGGGGTRMTLNSTGLGVGSSPTTKLDVLGSGDGELRLRAGSDPALILSETTANKNWKLKPSGGDLFFQYSATAYNSGYSTLMSLTATGNVGIGVQPSAWVSYQKSIDFGGAGNYGSVSSRTNFAAFATNCYFNGTDWIYKNTNPANIYEHNLGAHYWRTAASGTAGTAITWTQAMTLDASGNLSVGATAALNSVRIFAERSGGSVAGFNRTTSDGTNVLFYRQGSIVGDVSVTTTGTTFNSTSDYRLKEDVQPLVGGLARVSALKPSIYKWKSNGSSGEGFLAHELAEVVPAAVSGEKDAVNEDGSIKAQSIDMSRVVPILVAAIQELAARVQTLETR